MVEPMEAPAPRSHDRQVPTGRMEVSAATLFEAMRAARDSDDPALLAAFYRAVMSSALLLPVPPGAGEAARDALRRAVTDDEEVEVGVMLARDGEGREVSVVFGSPGALAAWAPVGTTSLPLPAPVAVRNLAAAGLPAVLDPAGPIAYRFEADELVALASGRLPGTGEPLFAETARRSLQLRLPGPEAEPLERRAAEALRASGVEEAYLVEAIEGGERRLLLGIVGTVPASVLAAIPREAEVVALDGPLLADVRAVAEPLDLRSR